MNDLTVVDTILRTDFHLFTQRVFTTLNPGTVFMDNWHIKSMAYELGRCHDGDINRLLITLPPRHMKSTFCSVAFSAWILGHNPHARIMCVSYSDNLAVYLSNETRRVMTSEWYQRIFPATVMSKKKNKEIEFLTTDGGYRMALSMHGSLTGRGGNYLIIDDPHKAKDAESDAMRESILSVYQNTLLSRLDNKNEDKIIIVQQRLHENDLAGHVLESGGWAHLNLPAISEEDETIQIGPNEFYERKKDEILHPARESAEVLAQLKTEMGSSEFSAQYQQRPVPPGGHIVKTAWFKTYSKAPFDTKGAQIVQSWDTAQTAEGPGDYSVCTTWLRTPTNHYLLDVFRDQLEFPALCTAVVRLDKKWKADYVLLETTGAGRSLYQHIKANHDINLISINPTLDKVTRMYSENPAIEAGRIFLPKEAPWRAAFLHEIATFPKGKYDDQVDSLSQFLYFARQHRAVGQHTVTCRLIGAW